MFPFLSFFILGSSCFTNLCSVLLDSEQWETLEKSNPNHFLDKEGHFCHKRSIYAIWGR
ncbi:CYP2J2: Cytochrome protein [Crotalus adamanteus]|uniref:CYP2J2: Cytochrome protein n=1 Tax=Crotalus adamanteus TaxID=8729 RepID=A0AAW1BHD1_CROAD